ncbi:MAG: hypothetical protein ACFBSG_03915 [Leptolyngbyaceae cyanobacterium]
MDRQPSQRSGFAERSPFLEVARPPTEGRAGLIAQAVLSTQTFPGLLAAEFWYLCGPKSAC